MIRSPRVGVLPLSTSQFKDVAIRSLEILREGLRRRKIDVVLPDFVVSQADEARKAIDMLKAANVDCIIILVASRIDSHTLEEIAHSEVPLIIWSLKMLSSLSLVGALALRSLSFKSGVPHKLVYGSPEEQRLLSQVSAFIRASRAFTLLKGLRVGIIGGLRHEFSSLSKLGQLEELLNLEFVWVDEQEVLNEALQRPEEEVKMTLDSLISSGYQVKVPQGSIIPSIRVYLALKSILKKYSLGALLLACGPGLRGYATACLAASLLLDQGVPVDCLSDLYGLLGVCMAIFTGGAPTLSGFLNEVDIHDRVVRVVTCGAAPPSIAYDPRDVVISSQKADLGRGAVVSLVTKRSRATLLRLLQGSPEPKLLIAGGEVFPVPRERLREDVEVWPHAFMKLDGNPHRLLETLDSPRVQIMLGDHRRALSELASMLRISTVSI